MKTCPQCNKEIEGRKKYCSDVCKWRFNSIKRDREKHLPPVKKRNKEWFYMFAGTQLSSMRGQGRRSGGMIKGGMAARFSIAVEHLVEFTPENVARHFKGTEQHVPKYLRFGDQSTINMHDAFMIFVNKQLSEIEQNLSILNAIEYEKQKTYQSDKIGN